MRTQSLLYTSLFLGTFSLSMVGIVSCNVFPSSDPTTAKVEMPHNMADMNLGPKDANFDLRFIDGMILHHEGAIAMAEDLLQNTRRDEMKKLAQGIIREQQQEVQKMRQWRRDWYPNAKDTPMMHHADMGHLMPMTPEMQSAMRMDVNLGDADAQFDLRFINAMIPHHEGAVVMAKAVLEKSDRSELRNLAQAIIAAQQMEIEQMRQWRRDWYQQQTNHY